MENKREVHNSVRVRTVQIRFDTEKAPSKSVDTIDAEITKVVESSYKEHFRVVSMTSLDSNGTTYAVVITFEHFD